VKRANLAGWILVAAVTAVAQLCVRAFDLEDTVAAPSDALRALAQGLASGTLLGELGTTLESFLEGFALAIAIGVALGLAIGSSRTLLDATSVVIEFLRPIPAVALIPLATMFLGLGVPMRRFVIAYAALWPILVNTLYAVRRTDRMLHDVARTSGVTTAGRLVRVTLPAALPGIATGVRVSASIALLAGVTAEFVTGTGGIGSYMERQQLAFQLPKLYAAVILVGALGYGLNALLRVAQRRVVFWVGEERARAR
jgi:ABC-type nitrate/sulfonate/bicarbonate transport system permease component